MNTNFIFQKMCCLAWLLCVTNSCFAQGEITIQAGANLKIQGSVFFTCADTKLINNGNLETGTSTFIFKNNNSQNLEISGNSTTAFYKLEVDMAANNLILNRDIDLNYRLDFKSGNLELNGMHLALDSDALIMNEGETKHIRGINGGMVSITKDLNSPLFQNPGNLGAVISSLANLGSTTIIREHQSYLVDGERSIFRTYDIFPSTNTGLNANLQFHYLEAELGGQMEDDLVLWQSIDNGDNWKFNGGIVNSGQNFIGLRGIDAFFFWTASINLNLLSTELVSFFGYAENEAARLFWETSAAINNKKFEIERSQNSKTFQTIGELRGHGTTVESQEYSFEDKSPFNGINFYRLKQIDHDGQFEYSDIISVNFKRTQNEIGELYPNPSRPGMVNLDYRSDENKDLRVSVFDIAGKFLFAQGHRIREGANNLRFDFSDLGQGIYIVKLRGGGEVVYRRVLVE